MFSIKIIQKGKQQISKIIKNNLITKQQVLYFSSTGKDIIPDEFYDDVVESEKEFCDVSMSLIQQKGLEGINTLSDNYSWTDLAPYSQHPIVDESKLPSSDPDFLNFLSQIKSYKSAVKKNSALKESEMQKLKEQIKASLDRPDDEEDFDDDENSDDENQSMSEEVLRRSLNMELPDQLSQIEESAFFTPHELNPTMPHSLDAEDLNDEALSKFVPDTDPNKFKSDEQGRRECPGGRQRRKREVGAPLRCHLIDLDQLNPIDIPNLKRFLSIEGEILSKRLTGLCSRCQRQVARTIKTSRSMGIIPHLGYVHVHDLRPSRVKESFHEVVPGGGKKGKPILTKLVPIR